MFFTETAYTAKTRTTNTVNRCQPHNRPLTQLPEQPRVRAKFELKYERLKSKFSLILFAHNLMIGYSKRIEKIIRKKTFKNKKKRQGLKFNSRLVLTGVWTTGPWVIFVRAYKRRGYYPGELITRMDSSTDQNSLCIYCFFKITFKAS